MKITCGTDIIEISRIKDSLEGDAGDKFKERVYTKIEIDYCESKNLQKYQHYAARFAAKEAIFKAISQKLDNKFDIEWKQIEVQNNAEGKPFAIINHEVSQFIDNIDISLSHCKEYATANVVAIMK
ncbi:MAG: holo-ACP synthase [Clostridia bacterium]|nr:holo-ACP synthase [Clostridia bacterium]